MQWWGWVIVAVAVIIVLVSVTLAVQARRRRGGVIIDPSGPGGSPPRSGDT